jgi:RNA polymerase sigma-70 factor (ECF subfamily)
MVMSSEDDSSATDRLLQRVSAGESGAVDELLAAYRRYLRRVVELRMDAELRTRVDPSDVVQETQLIASRRIDEFLARRPTSFRLWLRRKTLEQLVTLRRRHVEAEKRSLRREVPLSDQSSLLLSRQLLVPRASQVEQRKELLEQIRSAVAEIGDQDREMLLLRHVEELNNSEVAELLEIEPKTASKRYGRAVRRLRERLLEQGISRGE